MRKDIADGTKQFNFLVIISVKQLLQTNCQYSIFCFKFLSKFWSRCKIDSVVGGGDDRSGSLVGWGDGKVTVILESALVILESADLM